MEYLSLLVQAMTLAYLKNSFVMARQIAQVERMRRKSFAVRSDALVTVFDVPMEHALNNRKSVME